MVTFYSYLIERCSGDVLVVVVFCCLSSFYPAHACASRGYVICVGGDPKKFECTLAVDSPF